MKAFLFILITSLATSVSARAPFLSDKELSTPPSNVIRTCCAFGFDLKIATIPFVKKTDITSVSDIGPHNYLGNSEEGNGIIYTQRGGFIDLGHLRDYADWTAYLYKAILSAKEDGRELILDLGSEGGLKTLAINPTEILDDIAICDVAGRIAYDLSVWHEIATWYGSSFIPMIPERYSSFSPEDLYSNLLGVTLGIQAIKSDLDYNDAMTLLISNMLDSLGAVSSIEETAAAMEEVENIWWTNKKRLPSKNILLQRYMDTDQWLMPWLLPDKKSPQNPCKLYKPDTCYSQYYTLQIKLNKRIPDASEGRNITQADFGWLIGRIEDEQNINDLRQAEKAQKSHLKKERKIHSALYIKS